MAGLFRVKFRRLLLLRNGLDFARLRPKLALLLSGRGRRGLVAPRFMPPSEIIPPREKPLGYSAASR